MENLKEKEDNFQKRKDMYQTSLMLHIALIEGLEDSIVDNIMEHNELLGEDYQENFSDWFIKNGENFFVKGKVPTKFNIIDKSFIEDTDFLLDPEDDMCAQRLKRIKRLEQLKKHDPVIYGKAGERLFLLDGNHRRYLANKKGEEFIDAFIIDIPTIGNAYLEYLKLEYRKKDTSQSIQDITQKD